MEREQIIKALECWASGKPCEGGVCDLFDASIFTCDRWTGKNALALINSQEQRIGELENRLRYLLQSKTIAEYDEVDIHTKEYVKDIHSLDANIKGLTEEKNKVFEKGAENLNRVEEAYLKLEAENLKLTEENERLRAEKETLEIYNKDYKYKNKELTAFNRRWAKECADLQDECEYIKSDTVRKMQERLIYTLCINNEENTDVFDYAYTLETIDQIAKEMIEDAE